MKNIGYKQLCKYYNTYKNNLCINEQKIYSYVEYADKENKSIKKDLFK